MDSKATKTKDFSSQLVGGIIGSVTFGYFGMGLILIPGLTCIAVYIIARVTGRQSALFLHAVAIECAHVMWMTMGGIFMNQFGAVLLDVFVLGGLVIWLIARPGRPPALAP